MANYATLKAAIQDVIKTNGNNEITGALLQQSLLSIVNSLGNDYQFCGVATPETNPGTPDQNVAYIGGPGTYTNFNGSVVPDGYMGVFKYNGSWNFATLQVGKNYDSELSQIEQDVDSMAGNFMDVYPVNLFNKNAAISNRYVRKDLGTLETNSSWVATEYIDVSYLTTGDVLKIKKTAGYSGVIGWAFYNENKVFTHGNNGSSPAWQSGDKYFRCSIPASEIDVDMITLNTIPSTYVPYVAKHKELETGIVTTEKIANEAVTTEKLAPDAIPNAITGPEQNYISYNRMNPAELQVGYINKNTGAFVSLSSGNYRATGFIPVATNGLYCPCRASYGQVGDGAVYDSQKNYLRALTTGLYDYVDGDAFVRWTIITTYTYKFVLDGHPTISGTFNPEYDLQTIKPFSGQQMISKNNVPELLPALSLTGKNGTQITAVGLSDTLIDTSWPRYLKIYKNVAFNGKISQFNYVDVGFGNGENNGSFVRIDGTNIQYYVWTGTPSTATRFGDPVPHGLTISGFLDVVFSVSPKKMETCIVTATGMFKETHNYATLREQFGYPFVTCGENTAFSDVSLRCTADRFRFPIWFVGDSYTSLYEQRWPFQLINNDFTKFLLCGLAGGSSPTMYTQLQKLLTFGAPKFLVWCLGMNDEFWVWKDNVIKVEKLCRTYGMELILQTIPWPTDGTKALINDYVRNSGYRYIDVYKAVSSDNNGTWYDGMNSDGVHPTILGAKAIAGRVLTDFPEILQ